jgi:glycosyltransferase involved in cell wall biosynthesis
MNNIKVSICIPTYQQVEYLKKTLDSIQLQDFDNYEIIVSDDSRNSLVENLILTYPSSFPLRYFKNEQQLGSPQNWNKAISYARGEYIKLLHHDDWFTSKNSLSLFVKMLDENLYADFGFSATLVCDTKNNTRRIHRATKKQINRLKEKPEILFLGNIIGSPSATIYRHAIKDEYDSKLTWLVDLDFYIRILRENKKFSFCSDPLISTSDGAEHQITQSCINNPKIDLFEHIYLYNRLSKPNKYGFRYLYFLLSLFKRYKIRAYLDLKEIIGNEFYKEEFLYRMVILLSVLIK